MKRVVKFLLLALFLCGCSGDRKAQKWAYGSSAQSEALAVHYRCSALALEPGDVFSIELDVQLPVSAAEPTLEMGLEEFAEIEALQLPSKRAGDDALIRRFRWVLQSIAPLKGVASDVLVVAVDSGKTNRLNLAHAPIVVTSVLVEGEDPLTLPVFDTPEANP